MEKYKDQFGNYPTGSGGSGAAEVVQAIQKMGFNAQSVVGTQVCPNNTTLQDAWSNPIRYYYAPPPATTVGGGYDTLFQQNNCTPLYVSPGPNGSFDGGGDDVIIP